MRLESLTVEQVRNLTNVKILPSTDVNIIYGENAAGKTALLESIYLLSKAKSFRTPHIKEVIQHKREDLTVSGTISNGGSEAIVTGIRKSTKETIIKHNGERVRAVSEQAKNIVVQTAIPDNTKILTGSPRNRRKWIDWSLFHVEQNYLQVWRSYHHALRNRNALLRRSARESEFCIWEETMADTAKGLEEMWRSYLLCLQKYYQETANECLCEEVRFSMKKGAVNAEDYLKHLQKTRNTDKKNGFTQQGPHKADVDFKIEGRDLSKVFSRGQIKLFVSALSIAQAKLLKKEKNVTPIMLVDDLTAELDKKAVNALLELLYREKMQLFITATDPGILDKSDKEIALFHVKQGQVKNVRI